MDGKGVWAVDYSKTEDIPLTANSSFYNPLWKRKFTVEIPASVLAMKDLYSFKGFYDEMREVSAFLAKLMQSNSPLAWSF